ncbi:MAG: Ig-like domain-containing protein, partial [Paucibacter sp.]|nr:Ig-like domain-containing protein [Roseateles sp.]
GSAVYNGGNLSFGSAWNNIDTVRFTATTGGGVGLALDTINLSAATPPNLAPSFVGATTTLTVDENSGAADIKSLLHASDADSGQTLVWSQSAAPSHGTLSFSAATASSGGGDITPGGTITYTPTAGYSGSDSFTVQVSDGNGGTATRTITVTTTDINPVIGNASVGLAENSGNGTAVTTVTASIDTNGLNYAITGGNTGGAFAINASTGAITVANAAALDYESNPSFSLTVTVDDEDGDSTADSTATITINLSNVNEAPVNTVPGAQTFNEDAVRVFSVGNGNALSVGDVDAGSILTTVLSVGVGKGSLSVTLGGGASISGDGTNSVQIVGTAAQVQAALASVSYTPTANAFGAGYATLTISSSDNGAGTLNDSDTVTLNLNAVADTPSVTGAATTPATQSSSGLVFSRNAADGAEVSHFKITGISNGTLYLNDGTTVVSEGSFITFAQGNAGLKFTPSGASDGSFDAQASLSNNDGGLGGALVHAIISTGIAVASPTINEDSDSGAITISGTDAFYKLSAISGGTLYSDAGYTSVIAEGSFIASAGISTSVYFWPTANFNGSAGFSVRGSSSNNDGGLAGSTVNSLITVTAVNDAPTLGGVNHVFTGTDEDTASAGTLVSDILASGGWADVDSGALAGLALTASSGNGSWQYSTDGTNWAAVGAVSGNSALLLSASSRLRYLPDGQNGETATLAYRAWDQSSGTASTFGSAQKVSTAS